MCLNFEKHLVKNSAPKPKPYHSERLERCGTTFPNCVRHFFFQVFSCEEQSNIRQSYSVRELLWLTNITSVPCDSSWIWKMRLNQWLAGKSHSNNTLCILAPSLLWKPPKHHNYTEMFHNILQYFLGFNNSFLYLFNSRRNKHEEIQTKQS